MPIPKSDEVHIWLAYFPDNYEKLDYFTSLLSEDEMEKAANFRFLKDQKQWAISRGILRSLLGMYLGLRPRNIEILYGLWGKPRLLDKLSLYFNVSHSKDYVIYALSSKYEVGIDLEYIDPSIDIDTMAPSILSSPQELNYWQTVKKGEKISAFFKLWVCKEAFLKTYGKGWLDRNYNIPNRAIEHLKGEKKRNLSNHKMNPYIFEAIPGYPAALFIKGSDDMITLHYTWNSKIINK